MATDLKSVKVVYRLHASGSGRRAATAEANYLILISTELMSARNEHYYGLRSALG